jgi:hypothetical protein
MRRARKLAGLFAVLALAAVGCGAEDREGASTSRDSTQPTGTAPSEFRSCQETSTGRSALIVLCQERKQGQHGVFLLDEGGQRSALPIAPPETASDSVLVGHWDWAALSPDGETLLAQWSAECEVPIAFFVPARGGKPRVVSVQDDWTTSPTSIALGWTTDGRAIVLFPEANPCGLVGRPGLYLVASDGTHTRIRKLDRFAENLEHSIEVRTLESLSEG